MGIPIELKTDATVDITYSYSVTFLVSQSSKCVNPLTPRSDQHINSPYNYNILSSRHVMRIKKIINQGISLGYNTKLSGLANKGMYGHQLGEFAFRSWE